MVSRPSLPTCRWRNVKSPPALAPGLPRPRFLLPSGSPWAESGLGDECGEDWAIDGEWFLDSVMTHCGWSLSPRSDDGNAGGAAEADWAPPTDDRSDGDEAEMAPCLSEVRPLGEEVAELPLLLVLLALPMFACMF